MVLEIITGRAPLTVQFTDTSTYPAITAWAWTFGDGNTSTNQNPIHIYMYSGAFTVSLTVTSGGVDYTETKVDYVKVTQGVLKVAYTDRCFRRAIEPQQGVGWSEYTGDLPFPESGVGIVKVIDSLKQRCVVIFDALTRKPYVWANRKAPTGSMMDEVFTDKQGDYAGTEIACKVRSKEIRSPENRELKMLGATLKFQPTEKDNIGASGYNSGGFRENQEFTVRMYRNGLVAAEATATDVPLDAEVSFDKEIKFEGLQIEVETAASEFDGTEMSMRYLDMMQKKAPSKVIMTEQNYNNQFGLPVLWLSRGQTTNLNRADNETGSGSFAGSTTGPDGKTNSAMAFALTSDLSYSINNLTGNATIGFFLSGITATSTIINATNLQLNVRVDGTDYYVQWIDGNGTMEHLLNWNGSGWVSIVITRSDGVLRFYENGTLLNSDVIDDTLSIGGTTQIMNGAIGNLFDVRMLAQAASASAISYYYNDITTNSGIKFCPDW